MTTSDAATSARGVSRSSAARRCAVRPPSRRAINGLLKWIDDAEAAQRTWARNALVAVCVIAVLAWLAQQLT
jgi:hypothetical protein